MLFEVDDNLEKIAVSVVINLLLISINKTVAAMFWFGFFFQYCVSLRSRCLTQTLNWDPNKNHKQSLLKTLHFLNIADLLLLMFIEFFNM